MKKSLQFTFICLALVYGCNAYQPRLDSQTSPFPGNALIKIKVRHCREPSGIAFSARRGTLFIVGDEGNICELLPDGTLIRTQHIYKADLEGITINPATGLLYAIKEHAMKILEFHPGSLKLLRQFPIETRLMPHTPARRNRKRGIEAITFVPDTGHPSGGTFFIANQGWRTGQANNGSTIYEIEVPLHATPEASQVAHILRHFEPGLTDLSGIYYDNSQQLLLLISDKHDTLMLLGTDGKIRASYTLPGENQEGITLDAAGYLYIAQDSGDIIKYKFDATIHPGKQ